MNNSKVTLLECIRRWEKKREATVIEDGTVKRFVKEKNTLISTANTDKSI